MRFNTMDRKILLSFLLGIAVAGGVSLLVARRAVPQPQPAPVAVPVALVQPSPQLPEVLAEPVVVAPPPPVVKKAIARDPAAPAKPKPEIGPVQPTPEPEKPPTPVPTPEPPSAMARIFEPRVPEPKEPEPVPTPRPARILPKIGPQSVTLPAGTILTVRILENLSSKKNRPGDTFLVTLDQAVVADGFVIAERGAHGEGIVVEVEEGGRVKGVPRLVFELTQFTTSDGQQVTVKTESLEREGSDSRKQAAEKIGGGAALGGVIGAAAGGAKGAGVGAAAGGAAGVGAVLLSRGKPATVPSESKVAFRLEEPVTLTERVGQ